MNSTDASLKYAEQTGITASPGELLIMLLNAELKNIKIAILNIEAGNIPEAHTKLTKARNIMDELIFSLDDSYGISKDLTSLYHFIKNEIISANMKKDVEKLKRLIPILTDLRDTWEKAYKITRTKLS